MLGTWGLEKEWVDEEETETTVGSVNACVKR